MVGRRSSARVCVWLLWWVGVASPAGGSSSTRAGQSDRAQRRDDHRLQGRVPPNCLRQLDPLRSRYFQNLIESDSCHGLNTTA